ncbi:argininosuccinate lyase [Candidatus Vidania fulgoroideorum]
MKWSKRFKKNLSKKFISYNSSLNIDKNLIKEEISCLKAHVKTLLKAKIIKKFEKKKIINFLDSLKKININKKIEDIHLNLENLIIKKLGEIGKKIRISRSRNDLVTTELKMFIKRKTNKIIFYIKKLLKVILKIAKKNYKKIMPGFTHFQIAQPVTLGHYLLSYCEMYLRDLKKFENNFYFLNFMPLGSCALAGSNYEIDKFLLSKELKFKYICRNSIDAVSDRDYVLDFLYVISLFFLHSSRMCEEFIIFSNKIFNFLDLPDEFCSGSSIMPQKKNPDFLEIFRSKTSIVFGNLFSFFSIMKSLPLSYNKDYQEDKSIVIKSLEIFFSSIKILIPFIKKIKFNFKNMEKNSTKDFSLSTDLADYISKKGIPYKKSHGIVSNIVSYCIKKKKKIDYNICKKFLKKFGLKNINNVLNAKKSIRKKKGIGSTNPKCIKKEINRIKNII